MEILLLFGLIALLLTGSGIYIWTKKATHLLANFPKDSRQIRDRQGLARWTGLLLISIAGVLMLEGGALWKPSGTPCELLPALLMVPVTSVCSPSSFWWADNVLLYSNN